jgi:hypothetical protein
VKPVTLPLESEPRQRAFDRCSEDTAQMMRGRFPAEPALPLLPERPPLDLLFVARALGFSRMA